VLHTWVCKIFEILKDGADLWSLRFFVPAHFSNFPNFGNQPWDFEAMGFRWPSPLQDQNHDIGVSEFGERNITYSELETNGQWTHGIVLLKAGIPPR